MELFQKKLEYTIEAFNKEYYDNESRLKMEVAKIEHKITLLEEKHIFDGLSLDVYQKHLTPLTFELDRKKAELISLGQEISNQKDLIEKCISIAKNLSKYWAQGNIDMKITIQELVFPSGVVIEAKKRQYLTEEVNTVFAQIPDLSKGTVVQKKDASSKFTDASCLVAGTGIS